MTDRPQENGEQTSDFEDIVAALLKVDPKGITGQSEKHRKKPDSKKKKGS